jgi:O-antigen/teichoic acid export membrane protein
MVISLLKVPLAIVAAIALGGFGVFVGIGIATATGLVLSFGSFLPQAYSQYRIRLEIQGRLIKQVLPFALSDYVTATLASASGYIFPIIIMNFRSMEDIAYFNMAWMIANVMAIIPGSVSTSVFAECSYYPHQLAHHTKRGLCVSLFLLILAVVIMYPFARIIMGMFGSSYQVYGTRVLRILLLANFPITINLFYTTVNCIRKKLHLLIAQSFIMSFLSIGIGFFFLERFGVVGLGIGYSLGMWVVAGIVAIPLWKAMHEPLLADKLVIPD